MARLDGPFTANDGTPCANTSTRDAINARYLAEQTTLGPAYAIVADDRNYPRPRMTVDAAVSILDRVFTDHDTPPCREPVTSRLGGGIANGNGCRYAPTPRTAPGAVGCAFGVLIPPSLRNTPEVSGYIGSGEGLLRGHPGLADYFLSIPLAATDLIQRAHDGFNHTRGGWWAGIRDEFIYLCTPAPSAA